MQNTKSAYRLLFFALTLLLTSFCLCAEASSPTAPSLSTILDVDGSVRSNMTGNFDPSGYRMVYESGGKPKFVPVEQTAQSTCNDGWDSSFYSNGASDYVNAIVSDGAGNIYVGGSFRIMNNVVANGIAKWDGTSWSTLGTGVNGRVSAVAVSSGNVYVGGSFTSAGGVAANNIAKWDGTSWSALGSGVGTSIQEVLAIAVLGNDVYAGGFFNSSTGNQNFIARWNGSSWTSVGTGVNNTVYALAVSGGDLYVGGLFTQAGSVTTTGIAKWNGTDWSALGSGLNNRVQAIAVSGTDIYVGGVFTQAGGNAASKIAKWNGSTWSALGSGIDADGIIRAITVSGSDVYAAGNFTTAGGTEAKRIAKWNGASWSQMGTGIDGSPLSGTVQINGVAVSGSAVFAGGQFNNAGGVNSQRIAKWSANAWSAFPGTGVDNVVRSVAVSGTDVYVAGSFIGAGNTIVNNVAKWNGSTWSALGTGVPGGFLNAVAVSGTNVYVGGNFSNVGGVPASNVAKWDGTRWSALGSGVGGFVYTLAVSNTDLYVGGNFSGAGGVTAKNIAKWNGTSWSGMNSDIVNSVAAIVPVGNLLYVGTSTTTVDSPNYFLKYDGTTWTPLGNGMTNGGVSSIAVIGSDIYVAGGFNSVGGVPAVRIAKYNGSTWSVLGQGLPSSGFASSNIRIAAVGSEIYAVGDFTIANGAPADRAAKWNGTSWSPLSTGLNGTGLAVAALGDSVFVGGEFTTAGCNISTYFARWRQTSWTGSTNTDWHTAGNWGGGSLPSANDGVTIQASNASITSADVTLASLVVADGRTLTIGAGRTLTVTGNLQLSGGNLAGPGNLVVNGDLTLNGADVANLGSIVVNGNLLLNGGKISGDGTISVTSCRTNAVAGGSSSSFILSPLTRCVSSAGSYQFPVGTGTVYAPVELTNVSGSANFTVAAKAGAYSAAAGGLPADRLQRWWQLTNGGITQAEVSVNYADADVAGDERRYRVFSISGGTATQMPTLLNQSGNRATAQGFSASAALTLAQSESMPATLSGRVSSNRGRGAYGTIVALTDGQGQTRYAVVTPTGYYRFLNVPTFRVYTVQVISKRYTFPAFQRTVDFDELSGDINFVSSDH